MCERRKGLNSPYEMRLGEVRDRVRVRVRVRVGVRVIIGLGLGLGRGGIISTPLRIRS